MLKTGLVLSIHKNKAHMVTPSGEFVQVKIKNAAPQVGETFSGETIKNFSFPKFPVVAASIAFTLLFSSTAFAYYTPTSSVIVEINPSIMLKLNVFNRIIESSPLNDDGETVLKEIQLKNKTINDALKTIVDEAKKDNFINENYVKSDKAVTLFVDSKSKKDLNLDSFEKFMNETGVNLRVNSNGREIKSEVTNTSTKDPKNSNSTSKQNNGNKQNGDEKKNNDNKQNSNGSTSGNSTNTTSDDKKETPNNSDSSNNHPSTISNGNSTENNGGSKSEDKKNPDDQKKIDTTKNSNGNSSNKNNKSINVSANENRKYNKSNDKK